MTQEDRLNRLERIAKLFIGAGLRMRGHISKLEGKIDALIDAQIKSEDKFARDHNELNEKIKIMTDAQIRYDAQLAQTRLELGGNLLQTRLTFDEKLARVLDAQARADERIAASQERTDRRMDALIDLVRPQRNDQELG